MKTKDQGQYFIFVSIIKIIENVTDLAIVI